MTLVADFAELTKPTGECVELWNRERVAAYANNLGIKDLRVPQATTIADLCMIDYTDPITDEMWWARDNPYAELVVGFCPLGMTGMTGSPIEQTIETAASGRTVIGETSLGDRTMTMRGVVSGVNCCVVDRWIRSFSSWLTNCLSCDGMELRLLLCPPSEIEVCDRTFELPAEWATLCGVALTEGVRRSRQQRRRGADCSACGGTRHEVIEFTLTATDPRLYGDETCAAECTWGDDDIVCKLEEMVEALCVGEVEVEEERNKTAQPIQLRLDGTACPIGWDLADWDDEKMFMTVGTIDPPPEQQECKPYRVRLRIYNDNSTEWVAVNPDRWPTDGSIPTDCQIIVADIEYPNPAFSDGLCPDCPGYARLIAEENGLVIGADGLIDRAASGIPNVSGASSSAGSYPDGGPGATWMQNLFGYINALGLTTETIQDGEMPAHPQDIIDNCSSNPSSATIYLDVPANGLGRPEGQISMSTGTQNCNGAVSGIPGWDEPMFEAGQCGQDNPEHCEPTLLATQNSAPNDQSQECFGIELQTDGSWTHDGWDFVRDGVPPAFGAIEVTNTAAPGADDDACAAQPRDCIATVTVDTDNETIVWETDGTWEYSPTEGIPVECNIVLADQVDGTFIDIDYVLDIPDPCANETVNCVDPECGVPLTQGDPLGDTDDTCPRCTTPLARVEKCFTIKPPAAGKELVPRFVICAGSEPMRNFEFTAYTDPLGSSFLWDTDADGAFTEPQLDDEGCPIIKDAGFLTDDPCVEPCMDFGVRHLAAGSRLVVDPKSRTATVVCEDGSTQNGRSLLYGTSGAFDWDALTIQTCDWIIACSAADAFDVAIDGFSDEPASVSVFTRTRESG